MAALVAGVPQVVQPLFASDQYNNAHRVATAGAGVEVLGGPAAMAEIPYAIRRILNDPKFAAAAARVAAEIAALPDVVERVTIIEDLAR